jgi:hypothetical protein
MYENIHLYRLGQLHRLASRLSDSTPPPEIKRLRLHLDGQTDEFLINSIHIILFRTSRFEHVHIPNATQSFAVLSLAQSSLTTLRVLHLTLDDLQSCWQLNLFHALVELRVKTDFPGWVRVPDWTLSLPSVRVAGLSSSFVGTTSGAFVTWIGAARFHTQCQIDLCISSMTAAQSMFLAPLFESHLPRSVSFVHGDVGPIPSLLGSTESISFVDAWVSSMLFTLGHLPAAIYFDNYKPDFDIARIYSVLDAMLARCRTSSTKITRQTQIFIRSETYPLTWGASATHLSPTQAMFVVQMMHYAIKLAEYDIIIVDRNNSSLELFDVDVSK